MTTSSLVLVLADPETAVPAELASVAGLTLGTPAGEGRVPAVLECEDGGTAEDTVRHLTTLPGVARVEVVFVGFPEVGPTPPRGAGPHGAPPKEGPS